MEMEIKPLNIKYTWNYKPSNNFISELRDNEIIV